MRSSILLGALAAANAASAAPAHDLYTIARSFLTYSYTAKGFQNITTMKTQGGHAKCFQGNVPVTVSATNTVLNFDEPTNAMDLANSAILFTQINAPFPASVLGAANPITGTYNINSRICFPTTGVNTALPLHFLIHGVGFDKTYWDFYSQDYSYADYMAKLGYTTFSYDRLGVGLSDHPDPLQVVQSQLELAIAHELICMLRNATLGGQKFSKIVGVGHSYGSIQINALTKTYPADLDAAILTGFTTSLGGLNPFLSALNLDTANTNQPSRFGSLPNAYSISSTKISNQIGFYRYPNFDPAVLVAAEASKQTFAMGELFTLGDISGPATAFKGPVDVVNGENDLPFCQSNCLWPNDLTAAVVPELYPACSNNQSYVLKGAGHAVNLHYGVKGAYAHMAGFLKSNGMS